MSYNITAWKIKTLDIRIPASFNFMAWVEAQPPIDADGDENTGRRWLLEYPEHIAVNLATQTWELDLGEQSLHGDVVGSELIVRRLYWTGEGSGHSYHEILLPLLHDLKANVSAMLVWEGGDTVERLTVTDGEASTVEVE